MVYNSETYKKSKAEIVEKAIKRLQQEKIMDDEWNDYFAILRFDFTDVPDNGYYKLAKALLGATVIIKERGSKALITAKKQELALLIVSAKAEHEVSKGNINYILFDNIKAIRQKDKQAHHSRDLDKYSTLVPRELPYIGKDGQYYYSQEELAAANKVYTSKMYSKKDQRTYY